jgi:hypothetical protein
MRDIIEMARIAGVRDDGHRFEFSEYKYFERFVELARADAIADEREACAYRAGIALLGADRGLANRIDQAIRARGETK